MRTLKTIAEKLTFSQPPEIRITLQGDALSLGQFQSQFSLHATNAGSPWGSFKELLVTASASGSTNQDAAASARTTARITVTSLSGGKYGKLDSADLSIQASVPLTNEFPSMFSWSLKSSGVALEDGVGSKIQWNQLTASGTSTRDAQNKRRFQTSAEVEIRQPESKWARARIAKGTIGATHSLSGDYLPDTASVDLHLDQLASREMSVTNLAIKASMERSALPPTNASSMYQGIFTNLAAFKLQGNIVATNGSYRSIDLPETRLQLDWAHPLLMVKEIKARTPHGSLAASASLAVDSKRASLELVSDLDLLQFKRFAPTNLAEAITGLQWKSAPGLKLSATATLPSWYPEEDGWTQKFLNRLGLDVSLQAKDGFSLNGLEAKGLDLSLTLTNQVCEVKNLQLTLGSGPFHATGRADLPTKSFDAQIQSGFNPAELKPLLAGGGQSALDFFKFTASPQIAGRLQGNYGQWESLRFNGSLNVTNFNFRGEDMELFDTAISYANQVIGATNVTIKQKTGVGRVQAAAFNLATEMVYITNAVSSLDPMSVCRAIGPKTAEAVEPYRFRTPPDAVVNGSLHVKGYSHDLHFGISGRDFSWWKFNISPVTVGVHWVGDSVTISNLQAGFYRGKLHTDLFFDFDERTVKKGSEFRFTAQVDEADLHLLMSDLTTPTNHLDGILGGTINITRANTADWKSWQGTATAKLRDGYLWDFPLFGILSPVLNKVAPGVGQAKANAASGTAIITNSVLATKDLDIRTSVMHLAYEGTVDFDGNVGATVEAELLRDTFLVGRVVSLAFTPLSKLLEYRVYGTLMHPEMEPLHIPKFLFAPLHPFRTIKDLIGNDSPDKSQNKKTPADAKEKP